MFIKVQIYCEKRECCFADIENSKKPEIIINTEHIASLEPTTIWGLCNGNENYPYRVLNMSDGNSYLCVAESAKNLENVLLRR